MSSWVIVILKNLDTQRFRSSNRQPPYAATRHLSHPSVYRHPAGPSFLHHSTLRSVCGHCPMAIMTLTPGMTSPSSSRFWLATRMQSGESAFYLPKQNRRKAKRRYSSVLARIVQSRSGKQTLRQPRIGTCVPASTTTEPMLTEKRLLLRFPRPQALLCISLTSPKS